MNAYTTVVFDFDGTLVDSVPGIVDTLQRLVAHYGRPPLTPAQLRDCVGPPIHEFFSTVLGFEKGAPFDEALATYRQIFRIHALPRIQAFDGIIDLLRDLKAAGKKTGIATCKTYDQCVQQAEAVGLAPFIDEISGALPQEGLLEKADILRYTLEKLGVTTEEALMVGDRKYDLIGANSNNVRGIGVLYGGCGTREELEAYHPIAIVPDVAALRKLLLET